MGRASSDDRDFLLLFSDLIEPRGEGSDCRVRPRGKSDPAAFAALTTR
jgi:hypothetical protein